MTTCRQLGITALLSFLTLTTTSLYAEIDVADQFRHCAACHGGQGQGNILYQAPAIAGLEDWYIEAQLTKFMNGGRGAHPDDQAGLRMRPMARHLWNGIGRLDSEQRDKEAEASIKALAQYISKLPHKPSDRQVSGNPLKGEAKYNQICIACHGPDGKGVRATNAPALVHLDDWYILAQLKKFKAGIRGGNATKDPMGASMAPMATLLEDEQVMADVVAYIKALEGLKEGAE